MDNFRKRGQLTSMVIKVSVKKHVANFSITSDYDFTKFHDSYTEITCLNGASKGTKIKVKNESNNERSDCQVKIDTTNYHYTFLGKPRQRLNHRFSVRTLSLSNGIIFYRVRFGVEPIRPTPVDCIHTKHLVSAQFDNSVLKTRIESQRNLIGKLQRQLATYAAVPPAAPLLQALASAPVQPTVKDYDLMLRAFSKDLQNRIDDRIIKNWLTTVDAQKEEDKNVDNLIDELDDIEVKHHRKDYKWSLCITESEHASSHSKTKKPP